MNYPPPQISRVAEDIDPTLDAFCILTWCTDFLNWLYMHQAPARIASGSFVLPPEAYAELEVYRERIKPWIGDGLQIRMPASCQNAGTASTEKQT